MLTATMVINSPTALRSSPDWWRESGYFTADRSALPSSCGFKGTGKTDWNFSDTGKPFDSTYWTGRSHQPFYAQLNFQETHLGPSRHLRMPIRPRWKFHPSIPTIPSLEPTGRNTLMPPQSWIARSAWC